jgi:Uma2 family endonuclease
LPEGVWVPSAAIVVEVVSPDDETYAKFDFYAACGVKEVIVADPARRTVRCFRQVAAPGPASTPLMESERSNLLGVDAAHLAAEVDWP